MLTQLLTMTTSHKFPSLLVHQFVDLQLLEEVIEVHHLARDVGLEEVIGNVLQAEVVLPQLGH